MQRNEVSTALAWMEEKGWLGDDSLLMGLAAGLQERLAGTNTYKLPCKTAERASLHKGSMRVKVKKGGEGARQDYHVFAAFKEMGGGHELCVMQVKSIAVLDITGETGAVVPVKFVFGDMATCAPVKGKHLCDKYSDGPDADPAGQVGAAVHKMPTMLRPEQADYMDRLWFPYVIELSHVQASVLEAKLARDDPVYLPYVPVSGHG